jgi:DNA-binding transcriptional regulator YiaG
MLFDNLPDAPNEAARVRAAYVDMIAVAPRSTHGRIAAWLGVSSQHLSHWKAGRYPLNAGALRTLRSIIDGSIELPLLKEDHHAAAE